MITKIRVFFMRLLASNRDPRLDAEISSHLEMLAAEFERKGMTAEDAHAAARREFGSVMQMREAHRSERRLPLLDSATQDLAYAFRQLRGNRGFVAMAIVSVGLGIGANTAIFNVLDRIVLRSLPVADPDRLVALRAKQAFGVPLLREMNSKQTSVEGIFASGGAGVRQAVIDGHEISEPAVLYASGNYFRLLGARAQAGRLFTESDDDLAAAPVAVISSSFWRREFAGQSRVLGSTIRFNDNILVTVIGVTTADFYGDTLGQIPDVWVPMSLVERISPGFASRSTAWLTPMARLRKDVSFDQAQAGLSILLNQLMPDFGLQVKGVTDYQLRLLPAAQGLGNLQAEFATPLWLLMGLVTAVVLIASCNLANLLLARGASRAHEIRIRLAIGASRGRVIRQLFTESLVIAGFGGVLGLALAYWGSRALVILALAGQKQDFVMGPGWRTVIFAGIASITSCCVFGLVPAWTASRVSLNSALQATARTLITGRSRHMVRKWFGGVQIAISMLLVAGACLLVSSFWKLIYQDMGYRRDGILTFYTAFDAATFTTFRNPTLRQTLHERLNGIPGVQSAAFLQGGPLGFVTENALMATPERTPQGSDRLRRIDVSPRYFETMDIEILSGRPINEGDRSDTAKVAVITESAARKIFGTANPVGLVFTNGRNFSAGETIEVVGVAHDIRFSNLREPFEGIVFLPFTQVRSYTQPMFVLRTGRDPLRFTESVRRTLKEANPNLRIDQIRSWDEIIGVTVRQERLLAWLSGAFAFLAMVLAAVGVYGVVRYDAARRIPEIGVRLALGASPRQLRALFVREIMPMLVPGVAFGGAATVAAGRWLRSVLFELAPQDPVTLGFAVALFAFVVLFAAYLPARRAARLDPMIALRQE